MEITKTVNIYKLENGDIELADWIYRRSNDWISMIWSVTKKCNFGCPYCIKPSERKDAIIDLYDPIAIVSAFEELRKAVGKNIFITMTGGEPTLGNNSVEICKELSGREFKINLLTNACSQIAESWIDSVNPEGIAQIEMAYHYWKLDKESVFYNRYMSNFHRSWNRGITTVLKIVATPDIIPTIQEKIIGLQKDLPEDAPVLIQNYINGTEWPRLYTEKSREILKTAMKYRRNSNMAFWDMYFGFQGMKCEAGRSLIFMDTFGDIYKCFGLRNHGKLGNIMSGNIKLSNNMIKCPQHECGCSQHALWYGLDPWNYIDGQKYEDATYNRFGPGGIK